MSGEETREPVPRPSGEPGGIDRALDETADPSVTPAARTRRDLPFHAHVELLRRFVAQRAEVVERIQGMLNAQRKPIAYLRDRALLSRHFEDCFFAVASVTADEALLRGQLEEAHWARGFRPREIPDMHNDLVDPAEMMRRGFHFWEQTRWPGRNGRVRYAHTLFHLYLIRHVALLAMRAWDAGAGSAADRLAQAQGILDELWRTKPADQPALVRDVRWLIPVAQSYATDELSPYFEVAAEIADNLSADDAIELHKAVALMAGGHLRSYLHYYVTQKAVPLDDGRLVVIARKSNALDFSLLIHGLVPLLEAYERAVHGGEHEKRLELADAICQAFSPDPELFVNRVDLLGAYSMVEHLFTATDRDAHVVYTPIGRRHVRLLEEYEARLGRVAKPLHADCRHFRPAAGGYSPYGALYGFSSNLLEHMALKTLQPDAEARFSLEDVFSAGGSDKRAWVGGWRTLPHVDPQIAKLYDYPQSFAAAIFDRVEHALRSRASEGEAREPNRDDERDADGGIVRDTGRDADRAAEPRADRAASAVARTGRLFVVPADGESHGSEASSIPDLPIQYVGSSDAQIVAAHAAEAYDAAKLSSDRLEGHFLVSYETPGGWVAITKDLLTEVLGAGRDVKIAGLPRAAVERLSLMCRDLAIVRSPP